MSAPAPRLTPSTIALLLIPPLMWAGNAVVGRMMQGAIPPITFNLLRWVLAGVLLLPLAAWVLRPGSGLWPQRRRFALLGLLGVGMYNALQYTALKTSTPINVTLVASSIPIWMLLLGRVLYGVPVSRRAAVGAALSLAGVAVVLSRGELAQLGALRLVAGDGWMLLAYRSWGIGVARVGPTVAGFFNNLTPLFAALMSATLLGEMPRLYHAAGFVLIVGGILVSSRR